MTDRYERLNRQIDELLKDRSPRPFVAEDDEERAVLAMAARLHLLRPEAAVPRQHFRTAMRRLLARTINPRPGMPRRRLLFGGAGAAVAGLVVGLGASLGLRHPENGALRSVAARPASPSLAGWAAVGRMQDVPPGGALAFTTAELSGYIMRNGDQLSALSAICNHLGCHVQWQPERKHFVCPCDDAEFDGTGVYLPGEYTAAPPTALKPLTRLAVRLDGDTLYIKSV
ncbi:MAG: ubiquinol-cytochrome c reductase iron-sulfur subunit [Dehalococcoidia bacterium]